MGSISLQTPIVGAFNSTEDPKIASDFTTLQTVINGNLDTNNLSPTAGVTDGQLLSPSNPVPKLLTEVSTGPVTGLAWNPAGQDFVAAAGGLVPNATTLSISPPVWACDSAGLWHVAGKTSYGQIRGTLYTNAFAKPGFNLTGWLYLITGYAGGSGGIALTIQQQTGSNTGILIDPIAGGVYAISSGRFALPSSSGQYAAGCFIQGGSGTQNAGSAFSLNLGLYAVNA